MEPYWAIWAGFGVLTAVSCGAALFSAFSGTNQAYRALARRLVDVENAFPEWQLRMQGLAESAAARLESAEETLEDARTRLNRANAAKGQRTRGNGSQAASSDPIALVYDQNQPEHVRLAAMRALKATRS